MLLWFYKWLTKFSAPLLRRTLRRREARGKEIAIRLNERHGAPQNPRPMGKIVWLHGASVGESLSALPVIDKILQECPNTHVLMTTGTVTSADLMEKRLPARAFHQFIPVDHPDWVQRFINHWRPDAVIWLESDFWPNMLSTVRQKEIPMILMNARMGDLSYQRWSRWGQKSLSRLLSGFDFCLTQSHDEQRRLQHFNHNDVRVTDNLKYAAEKLPFDKGERNKFMLALSGRKKWQFVSSHAGEEELAIQAHKQLKENTPGILTVIIPRHPKRGDDIRQMAENAGLTVAQRSRSEKLTKSTDIYLADTMGEMGLFLSTIDITVVGGSFVPHGGHNPIEPAQYGNLVIYGPHMFNFNLINDDFIQADAAIQLKNISKLAETIGHYLNSPELKAPYQENALKLTQEKSAALENLWAQINPWLKPALESQKNV